MGVNVLVIIPALVVSVAVIGKNILTSYKPPVLPDFTKINIPKDSLTLTMPYSLNYVSARYLNGRILCAGANAESLVFELETLPRIMSTAPDKLLEEYSITHVLLGPTHRDFLKPIEDRFERILETNGHVLFKRK
jgi:hypothetical protein